MGAERLAIGNAAPDQDAPLRRGGCMPGEEQRQRAKPKRQRDLPRRRPHVREGNQGEDEREQQRADGQANEPGRHSAPT